MLRYRLDKRPSGANGDGYFFSRNYADASPDLGKTPTATDFTPGAQAADTSSDPTVTGSSPVVPV